MNPSPAFALLLFVAGTAVILLLPRIVRIRWPRRHRGSAPAGEAVGPPSFDQPVLTGPVGTRSDMTPAIGRPTPSLRDRRGEESR